MELYLKSGRDNQVIKTNGMDAEKVRESIFNAIKNLYLSRPVKSFILHVSESVAISTDTTSLVIGVGLTADATGKICWENHLGFKSIAKGYLPYQRYTKNAIWTIVDLIMNFYGIEDIINREVSDTMFEYAYDVESEITSNASWIAEEIENIENYAYCSEPDITVEELAEWIYESAKSIKYALDNIRRSLDECLEKCEKLTGCNIGWDDFCGSEYFEDLLTDWTPHFLWTDLDPEIELESILQDCLSGIDEDLRYALMDDYHIYIAA